MKSIICRVKEKINRWNKQTLDIMCVCACVCISVLEDITIETIQIKIEKKQKLRKQRSISCRTISNSQINSYLKKNLYINKKYIFFQI